MPINHDNDYHGDINYGKYPEDWYWMDTSDEDNQEDQQGEKELRPIEDVIDFGKGRLTSATDQQATWYQGPR